MLNALCLALAASSLKVSGWVVFWNPGSLATFERHAKQLDHVGAEWIECAADGSARRRGDIAPDQWTRAKEIAHRAGVKLLGLAGNADDPSATKWIESFLIDGSKLESHASELVRIAKEDGLDGIDLDYESLEAADKEAFSKFVEVLGEKMHRNRLLLDVAVHAKEDEPGNWDGARAQDWSRIGAASDVVRVMCYDYHWSTSEPGPIAPTDWTERVMRHAMSLIPARKLEMGIAGYGYDWSAKPANEPTWDEWPSVADSAKATIDAASGELTTGRAFFSGIESNRRKIALAKKLGLRGVALWYVGSSDPAFWDAVPAKR